MGSLCEDWLQDKEVSALKRLAPTLLVLALLFVACAPGTGSAPTTTKATLAPTSAPVPTAAAKPIAAPNNTTAIQATVTILPATPAVAPTPTMAAAKLVPVVDVVDGDTIKVNLNGKTETIRIIGLDTPETQDPRKPVQCFGLEASNRAKEMLAGKKVQLVPDPTQDTRDKYGRLLVYVEVDGIDYGLWMIANGYAHEYTYEVPYQRQAEYKAAYREAREKGLGFWAADTCSGDTEQPAVKATATTAPAVAPIATVAPVPPTTAPRANCDPSYPDVCIPPPPPDLDCKDVGYKRFRVLPPDPHRFDSDKDGIGCEGG